MESTTSTRPTCEGWVSKWTITAKPDELLYETSNPLSVSLSSQPGRLNISTRYFQAELVRPPGAESRCRLHASGIRIESDHEEGPRIFSCALRNPTTLVVEVDDADITFSAQGEATEAPDHSSLIISHHQHHLIMLVNRRITPVRMIIQTGTGDSALLLPKVRTLLSHSAHSIVDHLFSQTSPSEVSLHGLPAPGLFLRSRMQAASGRIVYPWLQDFDGAPVQDSALLYLVIRALGQDNPTLTYGLISNQLEAATVSGSTLPHPPLLAQAMANLDLPPNTWPADALAHLDHYLLNLVEQANPDSPEYRGLVQAEYDAWTKFCLHSGRLVDEEFKSLRHKMQAQVNAWGAGDASAPLWPYLLQEQRRRRLTPDAIETTLAMVAINLVPGSGNNHAAWWATALLIEGSPVMARFGEMCLRWRATLMTAAFQCWQHESERVVRTGELVADRDALLAAAVASWAAQLKARDHKYTGSRSEKMLWGLQRKRSYVVAAVLAVFLGFVGWLISVQLRATMPTSVFATRIGLIENDYRKGNYQEALDRLDELDKSRNIGENVTGSFRAKIYFKQSRFAEAAALFEDLSTREPANLPIRYNLGVSQFYQGQYAEAARVFTELAVSASGQSPVLTARAKKAAELAKNVGSGVAGKK